MRETSRIVPLGEALAAVDSPAAVADRRKRAQKWAEELEGRARGRMFEYASLGEMNSIREPFRTPFAGAHLHGKALEDAERKAARAADAVVLKQCEIQLRARDIQAVYNDPDRMEAERGLAYVCRSGQRRRMGAGRQGTPLHRHVSGLDRCSERRRGVRRRH